MNTLLHPVTTGQPISRDELHKTDRSASNRRGDWPERARPARDNFSAIVLHGHGRNEFEVLNAQGERLRARQAFDCLVVPQAQDKVHCINIDNSVWILHVLERPDADATTVLRTPGTGRTRLECEALTVQASQTLQWQAQTLLESAVQRTTVVKGHHHIAAGSLSAHIDNHLSLSGEVATLNATALIKMDAAQIHMG